MRVYELEVWCSDSVLTSITKAILQKLDKYKQIICSDAVASARITDIRTGWMYSEMGINGDDTFKFQVFLHMNRRKILFSILFSTKIVCTTQHSR